MHVREFGVRVTQFRERQHLSVTQLAKLLHVDYMQVYRYEKGQSLPSLQTAIRLAKILHVSLDDLTGSEPPAAAPPAFANSRLLERMRQLEQLPADRQELALRVLDTVISGHELESLAGRLR